MKSVVDQREKIAQYKNKLEAQSKIINNQNSKLLQAGSNTETSELSKKNEQIRKLKLQLQIARQMVEEKDSEITSKNKRIMDLVFLSSIDDQNQLKKFKSEGKTEYLEHE